MMMCFEVKMGWGDIVVTWKEEMGRQGHKAVNKGAEEGREKEKN